MDSFIKVLRIVLILFFIVWAVSWVSIRAYKLDKNETEVGFISKSMIELYNAPYLIQRYFNKSMKRPFLALEVDKTRDLFEIGKMQGIKEIGDSIYMLHYVYLDRKTGKVLLQNIKNGDIAWEWKIPLDVLMDELNLIDEQIDNEIVANHEGELSKNKLHLYTVSDVDEMNITQAIFLKDSSLIFNVRLLNRVYKINKDSKIVWKSNKIVHHSLELDEKGNIWAPTIDLSNEESINYKYRDDAIVCLDQNGNELYFKSLTELFKENNLFKSLIEGTPIYRKQGNDPFHLNDVQPVNSNSKFWNKGDVFLSIRNKSILALLRPSTNKIIWIKQGDWNMQHDVNIENDSVISIFNNNVSSLDYKVNINSNIITYNFKDESKNIIFKKIFESETQGRQTSLKNGEFLMEATDEGFYYLLDSTEKIRAKFYVPFQPQAEFAQYPGWARIYSKENGEFVAQ